MVFELRLPQEESRNGPVELGADLVHIRDVTKLNQFVDEEGLRTGASRRAVGDS
jgi:hypothetical protein